MGQDIITNIIVAIIIVVVGLIYYFAGRKLTTVKFKILQRLSPRYDSGIMIYESLYEFKAPKRIEIFDFLFAPLPKKCKIDLSQAGKLRFSDVQAFIDKRPITFSKELNWSSKEFDLIKMFDACNDMSFNDCEGELLELGIHYHTACTLGKLDDLGYLKVTPSSGNPEYMEIEFKNTGSIDIKDLRYEVNLSLDSFISEVKIQKVGETENAAPFDINFNQKRITKRDCCDSLINNPPKDNYPLEATCSFIVSINRGESLLVKLYYLNAGT